jgi:hypothetical protein
VAEAVVMDMSSRKRVGGMEGYNQQCYLSFPERVCRHVCWRYLHLDDEKERRGFRSYCDICNVFYKTCQRCFDALLPLVVDYVTGKLTLEFIDMEQDKPPCFNAERWIETK